MSRIVSLNRPVLWKPLRNDEMSVRTYAGAYPYETRAGLRSMSSPNNPVVRYAKNYKKYGTQFSLFVFTDEREIQKIDSFFKSIVKKVTRPEIEGAVMGASMTNFTYLDTFYGGKA